MAKIYKSDITSKMDTARGTFTGSVVWTKSAPPHSGIASWFENVNNKAASLSSGNKITATTVINDIKTFVSFFTNIRSVKYIQQYTKITLNSDGNQIGSEVITESTTTSKGILSSTGASSGRVTYKPTVSPSSAGIVYGNKMYDFDVATLMNDAITKWTSNYNSVVTLTYNRGKVNWTNHSQRGRR